jgi:hypothetical protein
MDEMAEAEAALDTSHLPWEERGRSFVLAGHLLTARLLASTPGTTSNTTTAATASTATTTRAARRDHCHRGRLVHVHQRGHGRGKTGLHPVQGPERVSFLSQSSDVLMVVLV